MAGRGPRGVYQAFRLLVAGAVIATLLAMASGRPSASPVTHATVGAEPDAPADEAVHEQAAWEPGASESQGALRPGAGIQGPGERDEAPPAAQPDGGNSSGDQTGPPAVPPRAPRACAPAAPLTAAAAAGEALPYVAPASAAEPGALADLEQKVRDYLATRPGTYGVAVVDLTTGATAAVGADQVFVAASTVKVPLAMYIFDLVAEGAASLEEPLTYAHADWEGGTGILQASVPGDCYTVAELVHLSLTVSDNIATNMLLRRFGTENLFAYMREQGGTVTNLETGRRATTPRDMVGYLERAYRRAAAGEGLYRTLMGLLTQTIFSDRIAAGAPPGVPVAHKIGTLPATVHDVGIVFLPGRPFAIAIFSAGVDEAAAAADLAHITRIVSAHLAPGAWDGVEETSPPGGGAGNEPALPEEPAPSGGGTAAQPSPPGGGAEEKPSPPEGGVGGEPALPGGGAGEEPVDEEPAGHAGEANGGPTPPVGMAGR